MSQPFYRAFEDRYRGSRETIKERLRAYLPFLRPLAGAQAPTLDLGCGRGEWLELLGEHGFAARGIDLDDGMLAACIERGLDVANMDALAALRAQPDGSLALVSAFHLVEHIPFDLVRQLIDEALRVLQPGGLLIMETPNPENLVVGASDFYTDPSHERPIPPNLLAFAVEHGGFARHKVVRLQEDPQLRQGGRVVLTAVLQGASPDYSVVAQKAAAPALLAPFDAAFGADYGIDMRQLAARYEDQLDGELAAVHRIFAQFEQRISADRASSATEAEDLRVAQQATSQTVQHTAGVADAHARRLVELGLLLERTLAELDAERRRVSALEHENGMTRQQLAEVARAMAMRDEELNARDEVRHKRIEDLAWRIAHNEERMNSYAQQITALLDSTSWRITAPMRSAMTLVYRLRSAVRDGRVGSGLKTRGKRVLRSTGSAVLRRPRLKNWVRAALRHVPALESRLYALMLDNSGAAARLVLEEEPGELSPRAARIYKQLKQEQARMSDANSH
ncbi:MAG TPA: class I SAM-dependent methyltransferase [Pseudoduganella sp.]|jgi:O-antigen chain-terminating methyltransferase